MKTATINNEDNKLSGWKMRFVTAALPIIYTMQSMRVPSKVCKELEKIQRAFCVGPWYGEKENTLHRMTNSLLAKREVVLGLDVLVR